MALVGTFAGLFAAGFAASEVKWRLCAKRKACELEAEVAHMADKVAKLKGEVRSQALMVGTVRKVKKKVKKLQKKVRRQAARQEKLQKTRRYSKSRQISGSTCGEGAVGNHRTVAASHPHAEAVLREVKSELDAERPREAKAAGAASSPRVKGGGGPSARDAEKAKRLGAKHPGHIPVIFMPPASAAASGSPALGELKLMVQKGLTGDALKEVLIHKLTQGKAARLAAQLASHKVHLVVGGHPLQADTPLWQALEPSVGFLHVTHSSE